MSDPKTAAEAAQAEATLAVALPSELLVSTACPECATRFALLVRQQLRASPMGTFSLSGTGLKFSGKYVNILRCVKCQWTGDGELKPARPAET